MKPTLLDRWGRFAARKRWFVIAAWVVLLAVAVPAAMLTSRGTVTSLDIPGAESQEAVDVLEASFPQAAGDYGDIVLHAPSGLDDAAVRGSVESLIAAVAEVPEVVAVSSPYDAGGLLSDDGATGIARVQFARAAEDLDGANVDAIEQLIDEARTSQLQVEFGGPVAAAQEREGPTETTIIALIAALVILFILFRTLVPTALPIGTAVFGLVGGFAFVLGMTSFVDLSKFAPNIAAMLGLGVGIDYALFVVARHRENVLKGQAIDEAIGGALATAGKSVIFAGSVVIVSLLGLSFMGIPFVGWIGVAAAGMVGIAVLVAITLLPALLAVAGPSITRLRLRSAAPRVETSADHERSGWAKLGYAIMRRPLLFLALSTAALLVMAIPLLDMRLGSADAGNNPASSTTRRAYDLTADAFGPGMNGPLQVVVEGGTAEEVASLRAGLAATENVAKVGPAVASPDGSVALIEVVPLTEPQASETTDLVHTLRDDTIPAVLEGSDATVYISGTTARYIDIADRIAARLPVFFALVIGISFLLLTIVFRSLLIPLKAALMNLISIGAAYGVVVAVFQWGWGLELVGADRAGPIESFLPMMLFAVLFGLSMDYEVFLVSRMREEYLETGDNARSVARGLASTASVISAAAAIMIVVFLSFVMNDQRVVKEFGLGLAVAVFVDATIVRLMLVPATMQLMGDWNWWLPKWLDRILPRISIEGAPAAAPGPVTPAPETSMVERP